MWTSQPRCDLSSAYGLKRRRCRDRSQTGNEAGKGPKDVQCMWPQARALCGFLPSLTRFYWLPRTIHAEDN